MTKREIYDREQSNAGVIRLYPEGMFYKAYARSAYLLCTRVQPFKISVRSLKGLEEPILSVGFPMASLDKFSFGMECHVQAETGEVVLTVPEADFSGYNVWKENASAQALQVEPVRPAYNSLPVYGAAWRLALELTGLTARLDRNFRYSLGEDIRKEAKQALLRIVLAGKGEDRLENIHRSRLSMMDVQISLRMLEELKLLKDTRYVVLMQQTEDILKQLSNWDRSERTCSAARVSSPPKMG